MVTGATDGIGLVLTRQLEAEGWNVLGVGRRRLADSALGSGHRPIPYLQADLSLPESPQRIASAVLASGSRLRGIVHNAAVARYAPTAAHPAALIAELFEVNLVAPILTTRLCADQLAPGATLLFVSSVMAGLPCPDYSVYAATKAALEGFVRSLRVEEAGRYRIRLVRPGATATGLAEKAGLPAASRGRVRFAPVDSVAAAVRTELDRRRSGVRTIGAGNILLNLLGRSSRIVDRVGRLARRGQRGAPPTSGGAPRGRAAKGDAGEPGVRPVCMITGACAGIGRALTERFLAAGYRVCGVDFDAERGRELQRLHERFDFRRCDLSLGPQQLADFARELPVCDVVIHNAGTSHVGRFLEAEPEALRTVLEVNLRAPLVLAAEMLRLGRLRGRGRLVFVSSLSHFVGYPGAAVYAGTKDGLVSFARSVAVEHPGLDVLTVFPGPTRTDHARRFSPRGSSAAGRMPPEQLAQRIYRRLHRRWLPRRGVLIPGTGPRVMATLGRVFPWAGEYAMKRLIFDRLTGST